jgi:hypothetical protein
MRTSPPASAWAAAGAASRGAAAAASETGKALNAKLDMMENPDCRNATNRTMPGLHRG